MPGESGGPVVTMLVCFVFIAREAAGAAGTRHSPRPLVFGAKDSCTTRAHRAARSRSRIFSWLFEIWIDGNSLSTNARESGRSSIPRRQWWNREAAVYWIPCFRGVWRSRRG